MGSSGNFSSLLPHSGFAGKSVSSYYWASKYANGNGDKEPVPDNINGYYQQFIGYFVAKWNVLGANYVAGAMLPFATAETSPSNSAQITSRLFMADRYISPVGLSWQKSDYQVFAEYRLYLPLGQYDPDKNHNVGKGQFSHLISLSTTYFFDQFKTWSASLMPRYEFHGERKDSNIKAGSYFNLEWALTNSQHNSMDFGLIGYTSFQLTQDTGSGVPPATQDIKDRVFALGGEWRILARKIRTRFAFRANIELFGIDRPIGSMLTMDINYVPAGILFDD